MPPRKHPPSARTRTASLSRPKRNVRKRTNEDVQGPIATEWRENYKNVSTKKRFSGNTIIKSMNKNSSIRNSIMIEVEVTALEAMEVDGGEIQRATRAARENAVISFWSLRRCPYGRRNFSLPCAMLLALGRSCVHSGNPRPEKFSFVQASAQNSRELLHPQWQIKTMTHPVFYVICMWHVMDIHQSECAE